MFETLRVYYEHDGHVRETANAMFCHYNSICYRIERIEQILGQPLKNPQFKFQLQLGVKLYRYREQIATVKNLV